MSFIEASGGSFGYLVNDTEGNTIGFEINSANRPVKALVRAKDGSSVLFEYNQDARPKRISSQHYIVLIDNYQNQKADFVVIDIATQEISVHRSVDFSYVELNDKSIVLGVIFGIKLAAIAIKTFGLTAGSIGATTHLYTIMQVGSIVSNIATIGGVSYLAYASASEQEDINESSAAFELGALALGFAGLHPAGWIGGLITDGFTTIGSIIAGNLSNIQAAEGILAGEYGDIQVNLVWTNTADLDLHVTDPSGETIYFGHPNSQSGGELDMDIITGYGPENVNWPSNTAPYGLYKVEVDHYSGPGPSNYTVTVIQGNQVQTYNGVVQVNQKVEVCSFFYLGKGKLTFNTLTGSNFITNREAKQ